jgi:hypothetical protein
VKTTRFIDKQIIGFIKQAEAGMFIKELCRSASYPSVTGQEKRTID